LDGEWDRRAFLKTGAAGIIVVPATADAATAEHLRPGDARLAAGRGPIRPGRLSKFTEHLAVPPAVDLRHGGSHRFVMGNGLHRFHRALGLTPTLGYGGSPYLGPTLVTRRGVPVELTFVNELGRHPLASVIDLRVPGTFASDRTAPRASVHLHGGKTPPPSDGHPDDWFREGASHRYHYLSDQEAAGLWYHDHVDGITRLNVYAGLAGGFLIRDDWDTGERGNGPGLPHGKFEIPLIVQDKSFAARRGGSALFYPRRDPAVAATLPAGSPQIWIPEFFGDVAVVNGKAWPVLEVARSVYRFRLYAASQARFFHLYFRGGGPPMWQIGTDQGLLDAPVRVNHGLLMAPGERADLLIDFTAAFPGQEWVLRNDAATPFPNGDDTVPKIGEIMKFRVTSARGPFHRVPARLRATPVPALRITGVTRNTTLQERLTPAGESYGALVNGEPIDTGDANIIHASRGAVELWNIINLTGDAHPIHLHLVAFQIIERVPFRGPADAEGTLQGVKDYIAAWHVNPNSQRPVLGYGVGTDHSPEPYLIPWQATRPAPHERGWKDTVVCPPGQVTRIAVPFTGIPFATDRPYLTQAGRSLQGYVWHCHILEHEDLQMMQRYRVG
jgi:FtsP/CotA-like multicopper oxidase with cupredoxin domain